MTIPQHHDHRRHADAVVRAVLAAADPGRALARHWAADGGEGGEGGVGGGGGEGGIVLLAAGKASIAMAERAASLAGDRIRSGLVVVPTGSPGISHPAVDVMPADHPLPTERNLVAALAVMELVRNVDPEDELLVLLSGGASAHLTLPAAGLTLEDLRDVTDALLRAGVPIEGLNTVRKHCERLKGGRLAELAGPAAVRTYALSDVVGGRPDVIGSGPTVADPTTYDEALAVLDRAGAMSASPAITRHLLAGARGEHPETPGPGSPAFAGGDGRDRYTVIGSNAMALDAAAIEARRLGFEIVAMDRDVRGASADVGRALAGSVPALRRLGRPACRLLGGETTVRVDAAGVGGPCMELALAAAIEIEDQDGAAVFSFSTDGIDGPTDAAGAIATGRTCQVAREHGIDPASALGRHDSLTLFRAVDSGGGAGGPIKTGPTGTNVNDVAGIFVY